MFYRDVSSQLKTHTICGHAVTTVTLSDRNVAAHFSSTSIANKPYKRNPHAYYMLFHISD